MIRSCIMTDKCKSTVEFFGSSSKCGSKWGSPDSPRRGSREPGFTSRVDKLDSPVIAKKVCFTKEIGGNVNDSIMIG